MTNTLSSKPNHTKNLRKAIQSIQNIITEYHDSHIDILEKHLMVLSDFFRHESQKSVVIPTLRKMQEHDFSTWEHRYFEDGTPITAELFGRLEPSKAPIYDTNTGKIIEPPIMRKELLLLSIYNIQKNTLFEVLAALSSKK